MRNSSRLTPCCLYSPDDARPREEAAARALARATDESVFNHWLEALQAEAVAGVDPSLPEVMRTAVWHDRKMESVLASWAELRHDTILVVEQSTGGIGCQYPKGYVEPVPELYEALSRSIGVMAPLFQTPELATMSNVGPFLAKLVTLSNEELAGVPMSDAEPAFLNETADPTTAVNARSTVGPCRATTRSLSPPTSG